jgi:hypothetical protein
MKEERLATSVFVLVLLLGVYGCSSPDTGPSANTASSADVHAENDHPDHEHAAHDQDSQQTDMEKMTEQLASFSAEDREAVIQQHFCPVGGGMLGSMGAPEKVDVDGQAVWICCDGCKDKLLADPETYLAKLQK